MKFINYLTSITGVEIFPLISLLVFFLFFLMLGIYILRSDKRRMEILAAMPIEDEGKNDDKQANI